MAPETQYPIKFTLSCGGFIEQHLRMDPASEGILLNLHCHTVVLLYGDLEFRMASACEGILLNLHCHTVVLLYGDLE